MPPKPTRGGSKGGASPSPAKTTNKSSSPLPTPAPTAAAAASPPEVDQEMLIAMDEGKRLFGDVLRSIVDGGASSPHLNMPSKSSAASQHSSPIRCHTYSEAPLATLKEDVYTFSHYHQLKMKEEEDTILERRARKLDRIAALKRRSDEEAIQRMRNDPNYLRKSAVLIQKNVRRWQALCRYHGDKQSQLGIRCVDGGGGGGSADGGALMLELVQDLPVTTSKSRATPSSSHLSPMDVWSTVASCRLVTGTSTPSIPVGRRATLDYLTGSSARLQAPPRGVGAKSLHGVDGDNTFHPTHLPASKPLPDSVIEFQSEASSYFKAHRRLQPHTKIALVIVVDSYPHQPRVAVDSFITSQGFALAQTLKSLGYVVTLMSTHPLVGPDEVEGWGASPNNLNTTPNSSSLKGDDGGYVHHVMCPTRAHILNEIHHFTLLAGSALDPTTSSSSGGSDGSSLPVSWLHVCGTGGFGPVDGRPSNAQGGGGSQTAGIRMLSALEDIPVGGDSKSGPNASGGAGRALSPAGSLRGTQPLLRKGLGTQTSTPLQRRKERTGRTYRWLSFKNTLGPSFFQSIQTCGRLPSSVGWVAASSKEHHSGDDLTSDTTADAAGAGDVVRDVEVFRSQVGYDRQMRNEEMEEEELTWKLAYLGRPRRTRHWKVITHQKVPPTSKNNNNSHSKESTLLNRNRSIRRMRSSRRLEGGTGSGGDSGGGSSSDNNYNNPSDADGGNSSGDEGASSKRQGVDPIITASERIVDEVQGAVPGRVEREALPFLLPSDVRVSGYMRVHSDEVLTMNDMLGMYMSGEAPPSSSTTAAVGSSHGDSSSPPTSKSSPPQESASPSSKTQPGSYPQKLFSFDVAASGCDGNIGPFSAFATSTSGGMVYKPTRARKDTLFDDAIDTVLFGKHLFKQALTAYPSIGLTEDGNVSGGVGGDGVSGGSSANTAMRLTPVDDIRADVASAHTTYLNGLAPAVLMHGKLTYALVQGLLGYAWELYGAGGSGGGCGHSSNNITNEQPALFKQLSLLTPTPSMGSAGSVFEPAGGVCPMDVERLLRENAYSLQRGLDDVEEHFDLKEVALLKKQQEEEMAKPTFKKGSTPSNKLDAVVASNLADQRKAAIAALPVNVIRVAVSLSPSSFTASSVKAAIPTPQVHTKGLASFVDCFMSSHGARGQSVTVTTISRGGSSRRLNAQHHPAAASHVLTYGPSGDTTSSPLNFGSSTSIVVASGLRLLTSLAADAPSTSSSDSPNTGFPKAFAQTPLDGAVLQLSAFDSLSRSNLGAVIPHCDVSGRSAVSLMPLSMTMGGGRIYGGGTQPSILAMYAMNCLLAMRGSSNSTVGDGESSGPTSTNQATVLPALSSKRKEALWGYIHGCIAESVMRQELSVAIPIFGTQYQNRYPNNTVNSPNAKEVSGSGTSSQPTTSSITVIRDHLLRSARHSQRDTQHTVEVTIRFDETNEYYQEVNDFYIAALKSEMTVLQEAASIYASTAGRAGGGGGSSTASTSSRTRAGGDNDQPSSPTAEAQRKYKRLADKSSNEAAQFGKALYQLAMVQQMRAVAYNAKSNIFVTSNGNEGNNASGGSNGADGGADSGVKQMASSNVPTGNTNQFAILQEYLQSLSNASSKNRSPLGCLYDGSPMTSSEPIMFPHSFLPPQIHPSLFSSGCVPAPPLPTSLIVEEQTHALLQSWGIPTGGTVNPSTMASVAAAAAGTTVPSTLGSPHMSFHTASSFGGNRLAATNAAVRQGMGAVGMKKQLLLDRVQFPPAAAAQSIGGGGEGVQGDTQPLPKPGVMLRALRPASELDFLRLLSQFISLSCNPDVTPYATIKTLLSTSLSGQGATTFAASVASMMTVAGQATGGSGGTSTSAPSPSLSSAPAASLTLKMIAASLLTSKSSNSASSATSGSGFQADTHITPVEIGTAHSVQRKNIVLFLHVPGASPGSAIGEVENALLNRKASWRDVVGFLLQGVGEYFEHYARYQLQTVAAAAAAVRSQRETRRAPQGGSGENSNKNANTSQASPTRSDIHSSDPTSQPVPVNEKERVEALFMKHRLQDIFQLPSALDESVTARQQQQSQRTTLHHYQQRSSSLSGTISDCSGGGDNGTPFVLLEVSEANARRILSAVPSRKYRYLSAKKAYVRDAMRRAASSQHDHNTDEHIMGHGAGSPSTVLGVGSELDALYYSITPTTDIPISVQDQDESDEAEAGEFSDSPDMDAAQPTVTSNNNNTSGAWKGGGGNQQRRGKRTAFNDVGDIRRRLKNRSTQCVSGVKLVIHDVTDEMYACIMARLPLLTEYSPFFSSIPFSTVSATTTYSCAVSAATGHGGVHTHEATSRSRGVIPIYCAPYAASAVYPFSSVDTQHYIRSAHSARTSQIQPELSGMSTTHRSGANAVAMMPRFPFHVPAADQAASSINGRPLIPPPFLHHKADTSPFYPFALPSNMCLSRTSRSALFTDAYQGATDSPTLTAAGAVGGSGVSGSSPSAKSMSMVMDGLPSVHSSIQGSCCSQTGIQSSDLEGDGAGGKSGGNPKGGRFGVPTSPTRRGGTAEKDIPTKSSSHSWTVHSIHPSYSRLAAAATIASQNDNITEAGEGTSSTGADGGGVGAQTEVDGSSGGMRGGAFAAFPLSMTAPSSLSHNAPPPPPTPYYASAFLSGVRLAKVALDVVVEATMSGASAVALQSQITGTKSLIPNVTIVPRIAAELADGVIKSSSESTTAHTDASALSLQKLRRKSSVNYTSAATLPNQKSGSTLRPPSRAPPSNYVGGVSATLCGSDALRNSRSVPNPPSLLSEHHYRNSSTLYAMTSSLSSPQHNNASSRHTTAVSDEQREILEERRKFVYKRRIQRQCMLDPYPVLVADSSSTSKASATSSSNHQSVAINKSRSAPSFTNADKDGSVPINNPSSLSEDHSDHSLVRLVKPTVGGHHKRRAGCRLRYEMVAYAKEFSRKWCFAPVAIADLPDIHRSHYFVFLQSMHLFHRGGSDGGGSGGIGGKGGLLSPMSGSSAAGGGASSTHHYYATLTNTAVTATRGVLSIILQHAFTPAATASASFQRQVKLMKKFATVSSSASVANALQRPNGRRALAAQVDGEGGDLLSSGGESKGGVRSGVSSQLPALLLPTVSVVGAVPISTAATGCWTDETLHGLLALRPNSGGLPGRVPPKGKLGQLPEPGDVSFAPSQRVHGVPMSAPSQSTPAQLTTPSGPPLLLSSQGPESNSCSTFSDPNGPAVSISSASRGGAVLHGILTKTSNRAEESSLTASGGGVGIERSCMAPTIPLTSLRRLEETLVNVVESQLRDSRVTTLKQWCATLDLDFKAFVPHTLTQISYRHEQQSGVNSGDASMTDESVPQTAAATPKHPLDKNDPQSQTSTATVAVPPASTAPSTAAPVLPTSTTSAVLQLLSMPKSDTTSLMAAATTVFSDYQAALSYSGGGGGGNQFERSGIESKNLEESSMSIFKHPSDGFDIDALLVEIGNISKRLHEGLSAVFPLFSMLHGVVHYVRPVAMDGFASGSTSKWLSGSLPTTATAAIATSPIPFKDLCLATTEAKLCALTRHGVGGTPLPLVKLCHHAAAFLQHVLRQLQSSTSTTSSSTDNNSNLAVLTKAAASLHGLHHLLNTAHGLIRTAHRCREMLLTHMIDEVRTVLTCTFPVLPLAMSFGLLDSHGSVDGGVLPSDAIDEGVHDAEKAIIKQAFAHCKQGVAMGAASLLKAISDRQSDSNVATISSGDGTLVSSPSPLKTAPGSAPSYVSKYAPGGAGSRSGGVLVGGGGGVVLSHTSLDSKTPSQVYQETLSDLVGSIRSSIDATTNLIPSTEREVLRHANQTHRLARYLRRCLSVAHHRSQLLESYLSGAANEHAHFQQQRMQILAAVFPKQSQPIFQLFGRHASYRLSVPPQVPQAPLLHQQPAICIFVHYKATTASSSSQLAMSAPSQSTAASSPPGGRLLKTGAGAGGSSSSPIGVGGIGRGSKVYGSRGAGAGGGVRLTFDAEKESTSTTTFLTGGGSDPASPPNLRTSVSFVESQNHHQHGGGSQGGVLIGGGGYSNTDCIHMQYREFQQAKTRFSRNSNLHFTSWNVADVWNSGLHNSNINNSSLMMGASALEPQVSMVSTAPMVTSTYASAIPSKSDQYPLSSLLSLLKATHGSPATDLPIVILLEPQQRKAYYIKWQHCEYMDADTIEAFCDEYLLGALKDLLPPVSGVRIVGPPQKVRFSMLGSY